jgi:FkbM family methyltransferase
MHLDIVEIGTSDFRTDAGINDGLFIEPVKEYFERLPDCRKENVAISNREGEMHIYYIPSEVIKTNGFPSWLRGCNSVNKPHPTVVNMGLEKHLVKDTVKVVRIKTLLDKYNVKSIGLLKIDTEGHDCIILDDFLDTCDFKPGKIQFEANILSDKAQVDNSIKRLESMGYACKKVKFDMVCVLL